MVLSKADSQRCKEYNSPNHLGKFIKWCPFKNAPFRNLCVKLRASLPACALHADRCGVQQCASVEALVSLDPAKKFSFLDGN